MDEGRPRFEADRREREKLAARFFDALREGDVDGLRELLAADVQLVGDGGGKARSRPGASSALTRWPDCLPRSSPGSCGST
jgi:RNA polymerase sigma-70 factor (ECF subfamily)